MAAPNQRAIKLTVQAKASSAADTQALVDDGCTVLGIAARTLQRLAARGELLPVKRGSRCARWRAAEVAGLAAQ